MSPFINPIASGFSSETAVDFTVFSSESPLSTDVDRLAHRLSAMRLQEKGVVTDTDDKVWSTYPPHSSEGRFLNLEGSEEVLLRSKEKGKQAIVDVGRVSQSSHHFHGLPHTSVASSSYTAPPSPFHSLETYTSHYTSILSRDCSSNALSHAPLPTNAQVLEDLSYHMADDVYKRYRMGFAMILPPVGHPFYPFWLPEHAGNSVVEAMLKEEQEYAPT